MSENAKSCSRPSSQRDSRSETLGDRAVPQPHLLHRFTDISPRLTIDLDLGERIALLVTPEYEGLFRNGGIGTYYTTLSHKLADRGWSIVLLLYQTEERFEGRAIGSVVRHTFSTAEIDRALDLAPVQIARLAQFQTWEWVEDSSYRSLLFARGLSDRYPHAQIYIEFPDLCGVGLQTIRAKRAGLLGRNCITAVTLHSTQEWLNEAHDRFSFEYSNWFRRVCEYEREAFETADIAFFLSYFLKAKVESYGWKNNRAIHLPYCFPLVESNPSSIAPLDVPRHAIPIVFFGRLEERKGLLTFIAAVRQLDPSLRDRLHLIFLGKSVTLHAPHVQSLTSREYIEKELGRDFTYSIETDRFSQEAIALVRQLVPAIVTLASPQENLPNTAFEMGQLPVSLVVSDTGGFREPLEIIRRSAGLYWFDPGSVASLVQALSKAIAAYPDVPSTPNRKLLEKLNDDLLQARLSKMQQAFDNSLVFESVPDQSIEEPHVLGMTNGREQAFLRDYARDEYSGRGEIIDLGCWLGSATICLAQGLEQNDRVSLKHKQRSRI